MARVASESFWLACLRLRVKRYFERHLVLQSSGLCPPRHQSFLAGRIGFYSGTTGIAYAAIIAGELLHDSGLVERGLAMLEDLQEDDPDSQGLDVISGSAGAIPVLLGFEEKYHKSALGLLAKRHGDRLLNSAHRRAEGWSWDTLQTSNGYDLTGFSHGTSGISWALLELSKRTGIETFRVAALHGFAYERRHYDNETENWPDFRSLNEPDADRNRKPGFGVAWCHGAPGIGLARLRAYEFAGDDLWRSEALAALRTTGRYLEPDAVAGQNFSLCHGLAGNAELVVTGAARFQRRWIREDCRSSRLSGNRTLLKSTQSLALRSDWRRRNP